jgi:L-2-hydroxycarboxylate dehydrogenase (NAD+)
MIVSYQRLLQFTECLFLAAGCNPEHAKIAACNLLKADLRGIDSHGVARLDGYIRLWEKGRINLKPNFKYTHQSPSTAVLDADLSLGLISAEIAMKKAIEIAENAGTGWVAVNHSNHFGIAGAYAMMALPHNMIGLSMTNASPLVAPTFGIERMLGTNPIALAVPAKNQPPFVADFATTTAANGKLELLQRNNQQAPEGWIQSTDGEITTDPFAVSKGGALLPLGSDRAHGSHKGFAMGAMVDILTGVLSGANFGPWVPPFVAFLEPHPNPVGKGLGHFFGAIRVDAFQTTDAFLEKMDTWIGRFRETKPQNPNNPVQIPGDYERLCTENRLSHGIDLLPSVVSQLNTLAEKFNLEKLD